MKTIIDDEKFDEEYYGSFDWFWDKELADNK